MVAEAVPQKEVAHVGGDSVGACFDSELVEQPLESPVVEAPGVRLICYDQQ